MATGTVSDILRMTEAGINEVFDAALKKPRALEYKNICREVKGDKQICKYETMGAIGPAKEKAEGDAITFYGVEQAYETTIESTTKTNGASATLEQLKYDLKGVVQKQFGEPLVRTLITLKEKAVANAYNTAFSTTGADGVNLISDSHPLSNNALKLNDNLLTGELSVATLKQGKNMFNFIYDMAGEFIDTAPTHLLIHPNKLYLALELLQSQLMALELSNTKNSLQEIHPLKVVTNRWLTYNTSTDVSPWFLLDKTLDAGVVLQNYEPINKSTEFDNKNLIQYATCYEMYGVGVVAPGYGIAGSQGS